MKTGKLLKGAAVPAIIALTLGLMLIGSFGYWWFFISGQFGGETIGLECQTKAFLYCRGAKWDPACGPEPECPGTTTTGGPTTTTFAETTTTILPTTTTSPPTTTTIAPTTTTIPFCPASAPSYPENKWDRIWCDKSFGQKLSDTPDQSNIQFDDNWGTGSVAGIRSNNIGFRSGRRIYFSKTGTYTFTVGSDDGVKVWIDGSLKLDKWFDRAYKTDTFTAYLAAGYHNVRIDFYENLGSARVSFSYTLPTTTSTTTTTLPTTTTTTTPSELTFKHVIVDNTNYGLVSIGDIDGDGFPDIIVGTNAIGLGWYKYPNWNKYSIKSFNWRGGDIDSVDIDRDGDVDVVGLQDDDGKVYWFENPRPSGNPTNEWTKHYIGNSGSHVKDMEVADFNRDGKLDVATRTHTTTSIFLQNTPTSWNKIKTISHPKLDGLDVGDLDRDGDPDLVLNGFWLENPYPNSLSGAWTRHNIDSKWWGQNTGDWRDNNAKVSVIDINGDGTLDVLIAQSEKAGYPVSWYEASNPKTGPWTEHIVGYMDYSHTLQAGDMDNDGDIDVVAGKFERPDDAIPPPYTLKVFYNKKGDGLSWVAQKIDDLGIYTGVIGDIGWDGDLDIIGSRSYWKGPIEIRENRRSDNKLSLNKWTYIQVDNNMPRRIDRTSGPGYFFGVAMGDLTGDGYKDIVAHRMFYRNPGGTMQGAWQRVAFPWNWIDAFAIVNVDGDQYGDVIAEGEGSDSNINIYWLEAQNTAGTSWKRVLIGRVPKTGHFWSQVYSVAQIIPGGKPEILIGGGDGVYYFKIPSSPASGNWPRVKIINNGYGYATGDINGDGFLDVAGAYNSVNVAWWKNPGDGSGSWTRYTIGQIINKSADRFAIADINRDGRNDIVVSEEVYPVQPGSRIFWFKAKANPQTGSWTRTTVVSNACSLNSMSVADIDRDGDMDIVSGEMGNPLCQVQKRIMISENGGKGNFGSPIVVDTGKESHLGARVADLDGDGDLDIISIGWNEYKYLHVWRNDA